MRVGFPRSLTSRRDRAVAVRYMAGVVPSDSLLLIAYAPKQTNKDVCN
jgi:hypothetical protein